MSSLVIQSQPNAMFSQQAEITVLFFGLFYVLLINCIEREKSRDPAEETRQYVPHTFI